MSTPPIVTRRGRRRRGARRGSRASSCPSRSRRRARSSCPAGTVNETSSSVQLVAVAEPHVVEDDVAGLRDRQRVGLLLDVDRLVEVLEDPVEERERRLHVEPDAEQRADREEQPRLQRRERDERRDVDRVRAARERKPAEPVDRGRHDREARLDRRHHPAAGHALPHLEVGEAQRVALEPVGELRRPPHRLAEQDPRDRERLLHEARDVGERLLRRLRDLAPLVADAPRQQHEDRESARTRTARAASSARACRPSSRRPS